MGETTLAQAVENADAVVSLVGILYGSLAQFEAIQWKGAGNIARAAAAVGAKLVRRGRFPWKNTVSEDKSAE
jgi:hypothetical protein